MAKTGLWAMVLLALLAQAAMAQAAPADGLWLKDAQLAQIGGQPALLVSLGRPAEDARTWAMEVEVRDAPPVRRVVLLDGPWAGAEQMGALRQALGRALAPAGWKLEVHNLTDLARESEGRLLILPSGAWPSGLMANWSAQVGGADTLIYLGVRSDHVLDGAGAVLPGGVRPGLLKEGADVRSAAGGQRLEEQGAAVWRVGRTLDEFSNLDILARELLEQGLARLEPESVPRERVDWVPGEKQAVVPLPGQAMESPVWARLRLRDGQGQLRRLWDVRLEPPAGRIDGPAAVKNGQAAAFQIQLHPDYPQSERVRYRAVLWMPDAKRGEERALGERSVGQDEAWVGSFTWQNWSMDGDWQVTVEDQFGRIYARALVHAVAYRLGALESAGDVRRWQIVRDGQVVREGEARLRLAGEPNWTTVRLERGVLAFRAARGRMVEVEFDGVRMRQALGAGSEDAWAGPLSWGAPAMALALLLALALRPKSRAAYRIRIPELPSLERPVMRLKSAALMDILHAQARQLGMGTAEAGRKGRRARPAARRSRTRLADAGGQDARAYWALRAEEAADALHHSKLEGRPLMVSMEGMQDVLDELVRRGKLARWREWYGPGTEAGAVRRMALMRQLRDRLMEAGIRPHPLEGKAGAGGYRDAAGREWEVFEPGRWSGQLNGPLPHELVFADASERESFESELGRSRGDEAARIRLALRTGRLKLAVMQTGAGGRA